jgi:DAK2 domain fusion protein YloV
MTRPHRVSVLDGQDLKKAMQSGADWLEQQREAINALNVFPVPDGDTGTNMALTMRAAMKEVEDRTEIAADAIAAQIARGALMGARGNSGVILSQILRGLAQGLESKQSFTPADLAQALQTATKLAYRAVIRPVEGTILTVVRAAADAATAAAQRDEDMVGMMQDTINAARTAVAQTPDLLPILKQAGVVDSGGQGLCAILEGIWRYTRGERVARSETGAPAATAAAPKFSHGRVAIAEEYGYEVVFLLHGQNLDVEQVRERITSMGGVSTVVAGDACLLKVHTHTLQPGQILDYGVSLGSLTDINIENLQEQSERYAAEGEAWHAASAESVPVVATVAVVAGAGFERVFRSLGAGAIVPGGQTMNPSTEELLAAVNKLESPNVVVLPNNGNVILTARQLAALTDKQIHVVPTETLPQGIAALLAINEDADFASICAAMDEAIGHIQTAEITTAVRSVQVSGVRVREGDFIGLHNGHLVTASAGMLETIGETLHRMKAEQYELLTVYYGAGIARSDAEQVAQHIKQRYPGQEIEIVDGGQPYYAYVISAE